MLLICTKYDFVLGLYRYYTLIVLYVPLRNITNFNSRLDPKITSIINRMLEKASKKRFKSWTEIIQ